MGKTVGIIGGIGPEATCDLMLRVIRATPAADDQDHIRMIVDNDPKVPSRVEAILHGRGDPASHLVTMAGRLVDWGAELLAMPCNSAHHYHRQIQDSVPIPLLDMISLTRDGLAGAGVKRAGFLCSSNAIEARLFTDALASAGLEAVYPGPALQEQVMGVIGAVKTHAVDPRLERNLLAAADDLLARGVDALVIACTELSTLAGVVDRPVPVFDTAQILAEEIVCMAR